MSEDTISITCTENGPYKVSGPVTLAAHDGRLIEVRAGKDIYLCRCGQSSHKPFCDGTHAKVAFDGTLKS